MRISIFYLCDKLFILLISISISLIDFLCEKFKQFSNITFK